MKWLPRSNGLGFAIVLALLLVVALYGYVTMKSAESTARAAAIDLANGRQLISEIVELQKLPSFAVLEAESAQTIAERVQEASQLAKLPEYALVRIEPQSPQRLGRSSYRVRPTRLELKQVTLAQVTAFAYRLGDERQGLTVRDLRLIEPPTRAGNATVETWSAEITLTQLIFSPTTR